jgi:hypothetical protein
MHATEALGDAKKTTSERVFNSFRDIWAAFREKNAKFGQVVQYVCDKVADAFKFGTVEARAYQCKKTDSEIRAAVAEVVKLMFSKDSAISGTEAVKILEQIISDSDLKGIFLAAVETCGVSLKDSGLFTKTFERISTGRATDGGPATVFEFILSRDEKDGGFDLKVAMLKLAAKIHAIDSDFFRRSGINDKFATLRDSSVVKQSGGAYYADQVCGKAAVSVFDSICGAAPWREKSPEEGGSPIEANPEVFLVAVQIAEMAAVKLGGKGVQIVALTSKLEGCYELSVLQYAALRYGFKDPKTIALINLHDSLCAKGNEIGGKLNGGDSGLFEGEGATFYGCRVPYGIPLDLCLKPSAASAFTQLNAAAVIEWSPGQQKTAEKTEDRLVDVRGTNYNSHITLPSLAQLPKLSVLRVRADVDMEELRRYIGCAMALGREVTIVIDRLGAFPSHQQGLGHIQEREIARKHFSDFASECAKMARAPGAKVAIELPVESVGEERPKVRDEIIDEMMRTRTDGKKTLGEIFEKKGHTEKVEFRGKTYTIGRREGVSDGDKDKPDNYYAACGFPKATFGGG